MKTLLLALALAALSLLCMNAHAEGGCPPGQIPEGGSGVISCRPIPGYNQGSSSPATPPPRWATKWGAIATDSEVGSLGTINDQPTRSQAESRALSDCAAKGGLNCKVEVAYDNECAAMIVGDKGHNSSADATIEKATQLGLKICHDSGDTNCHVFYSGCSLPQRIQ